MARKRKKDPFVCPKCGTRVEPVKTWQLISPFPDKQGRITITVMGSFVCPNCGYRWRAVISKIKAGGSSIEIETSRAKQKLEDREEEEEGTIIEIDIDED